MSTINEHIESEVKPHAQHVEMSEKHEVLPHTDQSEMEEDFKPHFKTWLIILACAICYFAQIFGLISSGVYLHTIGVALGDTVNMAWLPSAGQVVIAVFGPPIGLAADALGRKWFLVGGSALGCIGAVVTGTAKSMPVAIGGAVITGGAFAIQGITLAVPAEVLPRKYRSAAQAGLGMAASFGQILGIFLSGYLVQQGSVTDGWRPMYYILAGLYAVSCVCFLVFYRPIQSRPSIPDVTSILDIPGTCLLAAALVPFLLGLGWAENPYVWGSAHVLAPLVVGIFFTFAFGLYQWKWRTDGLMHHAMFKSGRNFPLGLALVFVEGMIFFSFSVFWPQQTALVYENRPFYVGMRYSAFAFANCIFVPLAGYVSTRFKEVRWTLTAGFVLFLVGTIGMATATVSSSTATIIYCGIAGAGFSAPLVLVMSAAQLSVPGDLLGLASTNVLMSRGVGGALATAIYSAVLNSKIEVNLPEYVAEAGLAQGLNPMYIGPFIGAISSYNIPGALQIPGTTMPMILAALGAQARAFADSFKYIWIIASALTAVTVVCCLFIQPVSERMTNKVDAPAEGVQNEGI